MKRIISGGQTGADRGALDAALALGVECGGWCPRGRRAEDGRIPDRYPLREHDSANYRDRTRANVAEATATVIFTQGLSPGTKATIQACDRYWRPYSVMHALTHEPAMVAEVLGWLDRIRFPADGTLNVAGNRESSTPGIQAWTERVMREVILARCGGEWR